MRDERPRKGTQPGRVAPRDGGEGQLEDRGARRSRASPRLSYRSDSKVYGLCLRCTCGGNTQAKSGSRRLVPGLKPGEPLGEFHRKTLPDMPRPELLFPVSCTNLHLLQALGPGVSFPVVPCSVSTYLVGTLVGTERWTDSASWRVLPAAASQSTPSISLIGRNPTCNFDEAVALRLGPRTQKFEEFAEGLRTSLNETFSSKPTPPIDTPVPLPPRVADHGGAAYPQGHPRGPCKSADAALQQHHRRANG